MPEAAPAPIAPVIEEKPAVPVENAAPSVDPAQLGVMTGADLLERFRKAGLESKGQRRSVTVLFVDLTGYTHLSEELGDEELYELVQKFIRLLVNDVYKYEGMVDKLTGDGLMALFGAPIAYENNAERALRSALDMQADVERLGKELDLHGNQLRVHIGLNAGSVIVGGLGGDGLMNYTAIGDSVNLSRRLEESAGPGEILVSESVYRQTSRLFDFDVLPPLSLKNVSRPVNAYRVIGPKDRPGSVRGLEGLRAPMIGRENEFRQALEMVDRLTEQQQGGVILLVGEGGMGKSRLTSELKARLDYARLRVLEGQSLTYRKAIAYWIFQDVLRGLLGVTSESSEDVVRARLADAACAALGAEACAEKLPYLEHMLSLEPSDTAAGERLRYLDAGQLRQQIFLAVRDLLLAEAHQRPLLLILEDLHWADDASLDLIRFLLDSTRSAPLLVYAISRPFEGGAVQAIHERASQRLAERYLFIRLQALPPDQSAALLQSLMTIQDLPEALRAQIIQRSAGLPFYLEEILRMLIENNIIYLDASGNNGLGQWRIAPGADTSAIGVPETLQGLILTRFDRLTPLQRRVLQTASVIGYQFSEPVLRQVITGAQADGASADAAATVAAATDAALSETLAHLTEHEYITRLVGESGGVDDYVFKHVLVSDAVYSTLLQRDRRELHTRAGQAIEQLFAGRLDGQIEVLAGHFLRSPLLDRALHYLTLAGQKAARSYANEQARLYFSQALEVLQKTEHTFEQAVPVYLGLGDALLTAGDYPAAREQFAHGLEVLGARPGTGTLESAEADAWAERRRQASQLQCKIARTHEGQGDYEKALACLRAAQAMLEGGSDQHSLAERANILNDMGWVDFRRGALDTAETALREGLALAEAADQPDVLASLLNRLAGIFFQRDDPEQAARFLARSLVLRERIGDVVGMARCFNNLGLLGWKQGDLASALDNFNHSYKQQANLGDVEGLIVLHTNMGMIELDLGDLAEAQHHFQDALNSATDIGHFFHVCEARMHLALLSVYAGEWRRALEHGQLARIGFQEMGVQENMLDLHVSLGWAYLGLDDMPHLDEILQQIDELMTDAARSDAARAGAVLEGEGRARRLIGRAAQQRGDLPAARAALEQSAAIFSQLNNPLERGRVLVDLAALRITCGETVEAQSLLDEASETFTRMGAKLELERSKQVAEKISA